MLIMIMNNDTGCDGGGGGGGEGEGGGTKETLGG